MGAIVTGGASGLGAATARLLAARGARVVVVDVHDEEGMTIAAEIGGQYAHADVRDDTEVRAAVELAAQEAPLRMLVNCAGVAPAAPTITPDGSYDGAFPLDLFESVIAVNLVGTFNCIRLAASAMSRTDPLPDGERGAIVNTSSIAASEGIVGQAAYAASKAGVDGMTITLARDLASAGIRVNTISPGLMETPIWGSDEVVGEVKQAMRSHVPFPRRLGESAEFARLAMELLTNGYLNGATVRLDGGLRLQAFYTS